MAADEDDGTEVVEHVEIPTLNLLDLEQLQRLIVILKAGNVVHAVVGELTLDFAPRGSVSTQNIGFSADASDDEDEDEMKSRRPTPRSPDYVRAFGGKVPTLKSEKPESEAPSE